LDTLSDSKRILQISTDLKMIRESSINEKLTTHGINHTSAPDSTPIPCTSPYTTHIQFQTPTNTQKTKNEIKKKIKTSSK
jgi:hypothetical protein